MKIRKVVQLIESIIPEEEVLEDFDLKRKHDHIYCIEWGEKKQRQIEREIQLKMIEDLLGNNKNN